MGDDLDDAPEDVAFVLRSALAGDQDNVVKTFDQLEHANGVEQVYRVAWELARHTVGPNLPRGPWRLDFPGIDDAEYDARWVARFLSAYVNDDLPTGEALFGAAIADGKLPECLMTLAGSAAATMRRRDG